MMINPPIKESSSWRDPQGHIYHYDGRIFRSVLATAKNDFDFVRSTPLINTLIDQKKLAPIYDQGILILDAIGALENTNTF